MCALIKVGERGKFTFKDKRKKTKIIKPTELVKDRQSEIVYQYSKMGFNFHSLLRLKPEQKDFKGFVLDEHTTKAYNNKMGQNYVDRIMDKFTNRKSIECAFAFIERDDFLNNHLHFAWKTPIELTREIIANQMRTKIQYLRDVQKIEGIEDAIRYFSKKLSCGGSYHNIYV